MGVPNIWGDTQERRFWGVPKSPPESFFIGANDTNDRIVGTVCVKLRQAICELRGRLLNDDNLLPENVKEEHDNLFEPRRRWKLWCVWAKGGARLVK